MVAGLLALSLLLSGCTALLITEEDPASAVAAKVFWRAILGASTLGLSEIALAEVRQNLERDLTLEARLSHYEQRLTFLVNNGGLTHAQAEELYLRYAALLMLAERESAQPRNEVVTTTRQVVVLPSVTPRSIGYLGLYHPPTYASVPPVPRLGRSSRGIGAGSVYVRPYVRRDGTSVRGHWRGRPGR